MIALIEAGSVGARAPAETGDIGPYLAAFRHMDAHPDTELYVARSRDGDVVGMLILSFVYGLAFQGKPRAQAESVHVRADFRSQGIGTQLMAHIIQRAREKGCCMVQLTSNKARDNAHRFYERLGFVPSHTGFKLML
ncbi:GNAT family N-acetyltransferase [Stappia sp. F7233]|uniref:GNAT family N-acetyltransferase n=2 Tax=Stappia albiluteola TaxID=2758565 RepID=A0A839AE08_9HYPH|nr:GNAT family N-acetyltransferase [Stappia albiluteola]